MVNFWISFLFILFTWVLGVFIEGVTTQTIYISGLFFSLYFIIPLFKRTLTQIIYFLLPILVAILFTTPGFNGFVWLVFLALALQAGSIFQESKLVLYVIYLYGLAVSSHIIFQEWLLLLYLTLLAIMTGILYFNLRKSTSNEQVLENELNELKDDFQSLKHQLVNNEQSVRQEERNQIAREIHDSVGHRLTALLMQLEVERIKATDEQSKNRLTELKKLAQTSLYDTREAVKALQSEETAGIQAIIQLIRKLEAESQLRLTITMQAGVLGLYLSNQQSVAIYRSIQEALTNMMRHSSSRQAEIEFKIIADTELRFRVSHPIKEKVLIQEGFGLKNIRERLSEIDGRLTIDQANQSLNVIGQFPLEEKSHG